MPAGVVAARGDRLGAEEVGVGVGTGPRNLRPMSSGPPEAALRNQELLAFEKGAHGEDAWG